MIRWQDIRGVLCDMDGVLWRGHLALPGLVSWFDFLRQRNLAFALLTNNSTQTARDYAAKLDRLGVHGVQEAQIVTSASATAQVALARHGSGAVVYVVGEEGLRRSLEQVGLVMLRDEHFQDDSAPQAVVVGLDRALSYDKAKRAMRFIQAGADFIGTNPDTSFPLPDGLAPGAGSVIAMIQAASGQTPLVVGKPHRAMYDVALERLGLPAEAVLMVGDRLDTDIDGAQALGMMTALVLTGISTRKEAEAASPPPDWVGAGLPQLVTDWRAGLA
ncbi:MAG: HAD-IIA family hydrolase [Anaerolineae bacterium]|nr:HAD-IIA family hydrolase [Anaerolineae bacterium]